MPVSDFECQIARGQIGRYVEGGALSAQAMTGLEEHLAECPACKALVAERRAALLGSLNGGISGGATPTKAVVEMPVENPLVAALREKQKIAPAEKKAPEKPKAEAPKTKAAPRYATKKASAGDKAAKPLGKPLALAALLAVVLLGMSRVSQFVGTPASKASMSFASETTPTKPAAQTPEVKPEATSAVTPVAKTEPAPAPATPKTEAPSPATPVAKPGPATLKPSAPKTEAPKPAPAVTTAPKPVAKPTLKAEASEPVVDKKPVPVPPVVAKPVAPKAAAPKPVVKRAVRKVAKRKTSHKRVAKHVARRSGSSVRVYGADGRPLN